MSASSTACFVVEAKYAAGAEDNRAPFRSEHLERMGKLFDEGALLMAGAYDDLSASLLVLAVQSEKAARAIVESDIYFKNKVWTGYSVKKLNKVDFDG